MTSRTTIALSTAILALASLTACGESAEQVAPETQAATSAESSAEPEAVTDTTGDDDADDADDVDDASAAAPAAPASGEPPAAVTDYTQEARTEMAEEDVSEADVEAALAAARNGEAEVEWDDDGYWEIDWRDVDVDINADGLVLDADR